MDTKIRVLLVEDEKIVAEAICALLSTEPGLMVIAQAETGESAIRKARLVHPDVILLDLHLSDQSGVEVVTAIMQENPQARIVILTAFADEQEVAAAFRAGVIGYVLKTQAIDDLVKAIENAYEGRSCVPPNIARIMLSTLNPERKRCTQHVQLSDAELRVLSFVGKGLQNKEIAHLLGLSRQTVHGHVSHILTKLKLENRTQAAIYAYRQGITT